MKDIPLPDAVMVGSEARLLGGSGSVGVGVAEPRAASRGKSAADFILKVDRDHNG
jgi:hypothetical protein